MVLVIDKRKRSCNAISEAYARILLYSKQAVIHKRFPFTIRLKSDNAVKKDCSYIVKFDPGANTTGVAIVDSNDDVVLLAEIEHRGKVVKCRMDSRRLVRRFRRQRKTRYREARFQNRIRSEGWLAPSVKSRADNVINFIKKYKRLINIDKVMIERVSFDTAQMSSDEKLLGRDYQQGALYQKKLRSFIFDRSHNRCVYCGAKAEEIDHIIARRVQSARNYMVKEITRMVPNTTTHDAWLTRYNREEFGLSKQHYYDALSVGAIKDYKFLTDKVLVISAKGRGSRQMCCMDKFGFPRTFAKASKIVKGFQTGDIVKAIVPIGLKRGEYLGRVVVRSSGSFNITTQDGLTRQGIGYKYCRIIQRNDGYSYNCKERDFLSAMNCRVSVAKLK